ncbi:extracellular solute-binding protein [Vagococcus coleopterorum]|uniref:Extracellular solute-binding protein n=1 Tax=Vagococcus coleopterorum TaxID=2714946 RepID=A0A6G8AL25_9ENTE|nr:extracellular solute-binding protein [Vagococcus coleopterorum]QIL45662.1 extracellular solute-binding protein [Vagococcus coleopterorum]
MKKLSVIGLLFLTSVLVFVGCTSNKEDKEGATENKLVVYSPNSEGLIAATIPGFEEKTGIKVELVQAGTGELFKKIETEKDAPVADVIFGGAYSQYAVSKDLFEKYTSSENGKMVESYRNTTGYYTPYTIDGSVILANKKLTSGKKIKGYSDLLDSDFKGKISSADPANSSSAFAQLTNMLQAMGGYEKPESWKYVEDVFTLIDGKISSSSSNVYKAVADGEMSVALTYEDPSVKLLNDGADVEIIYPEEGVVFLPASAAVIKNANHEKNAQAFIDYLISKDTQDRLGKETTNRPVRSDAETSDNMLDLSKIHAIDEDMDYVINHKDELVKKYNDIFVDIQSK